MSVSDRNYYKYVHSAFLCLCLPLLAAAGCGGTSSQSSSSTTKVLSSIAASPATANLAAGATQQFTATATNLGGSLIDVTATATWTVANTSVATVAADGLATGVAAGSTTITASLPSGVSSSASITVTLPIGAGTNIVTWHVDNNRSGLNPNETSLTPANLAAGTFGKLFSYLVDGYAYAEPLLMSNVTIGGAKHNVLYVATENDSVYAFDADHYGNGAPLWHTSLLNSSANEAPIDGPIQPYEGVTSTPVIDPATGTIYVVSVQKPSSGAAGFRLNALDITTGAQKPRSPVALQASVAATNSDAVGGVETLPTSCIQRAALLLAKGTLYIGFGGCHSGWLLSYDAHTLTQTGVFNASPNLNGEGPYASAGGVWMGSGGPAADSAGNIYITTGNGPWDAQKAWGDSVLKFNPNLTLNSGGKQVQDYFTPVDYAYMDCDDSDLAAGGLLLIPGTSQALAGGKMGKLYLVNTANLGREQTDDAGAAQTLAVEQGLSSPYTSPACPYAPGNLTATINSYEIFGTAAFFNGSLYLGVTPTSSTAPAVVRRFTYSSRGLAPAEFTSPSVQQNTRGTTPFISANGSSDGILWMIDEGQPIQSSAPTSATLRAYDAGNLSKELYSGTNSGDIPGYGIKFSSPIVANGKVYISTGHDLSTVAHPQGEIDVYGLK
jgi:Bacterial Ig-like domain (group 2)